MWEQEEFEKHWKNEFPDGDVPVMDLSSAEDVEAELEKCKAKLKVLQRALSEEKFKVIYLQTTVAQRKKNHDEKAVWRGSKTGKPVPVPPRKKPEILQENSPPQDVSQADGKRDSDHDYEDEDLNENFLQRNLVNPKRNARESVRGNLLVRMSRDLDFNDGRVSPSVLRGSGRSTPDRRSDGYLSSEHDDSSSAGKTRLHKTFTHLPSECVTLTLYSCADITHEERRNIEAPKNNIHTSISQ